MYIYKKNLNHINVMNNFHNSLKTNWKTIIMKSK